MNGFGDGATGLAVTGLTCAGGVGGFFTAGAIDGRGIAVGGFSFDSASRSFFIVRIMNWEFRSKTLFLSSLLEFGDDTWILAGFFISM